MSDDRIRDLIRELPGTEADPDVRARLRQEFVAGTLSGEAGGADAGATGPRKIVTIGWSAGIAIAAVLALLFFTWPQAPQWDVVAASGEGTVTVNGSTYPAGEAAEALGKTLPAGTRIRVDGAAMLDLNTPGVIAIQMAGGSAMEVPGRKGWWSGGGFAGAVTQGEVRFVTGPGFQGQKLVVDAPAAKALVTGTTFAVITNADTTCVCVLDGRVTMEGPDGARQVVEGGKRRTVFRETGRAYEEPILPMEQMKLEMLRGRVRGE